MFKLFGAFVIAWMAYDLIMTNIIEATFYPPFPVFAGFAAALVFVVTKLMSQKN